MVTSREQREQMEKIAGQVQNALQTADLAGYRELLDPNVTWGADGDRGFGCQNRAQVLSWYRRGRAKGVRAEVTETIVGDDKILVGLSILGRQLPPDSGDRTQRWQVLSVKNGLIVDIRGFEERAAAIARLQ